MVVDQHEAHWWEFGFATWFGWCCSDAWGTPKWYQICAASRMPHHRGGYQSVPQVPLAPLEVRARPIIEGLAAPTEGQLDFLERWRSFDGCWPLDDRQWLLFAAELIEMVKSSPYGCYQSFSGRATELLDEVARRQDDFEVVMELQDRLASILHAYVPHRQPPREPHRSREERLRDWEADLGALPVWMGLRDPSKRPRWDAPGSIDWPFRMARLEHKWQTELHLMEGTRRIRTTSGLSDGSFLRGAVLWTPPGGRPGITSVDGGLRPAESMAAMPRPLPWSRWWRFVEPGNLAVLEEANPWSSCGGFPRVSALWDVFWSTLPSTTWGKRQAASPSQLGSSLGIAWSWSSWSPSTYHRKRTFLHRRVDDGLDGMQWWLWHAGAPGRTLPCRRAFYGVVFCFFGSTGDGTANVISSPSIRGRWDRCRSNLPPSYCSECQPSRGLSDHFPHSLAHSGRYRAKRMVSGQLLKRRSSRQHSARQSPYLCRCFFWPDPGLARTVRYPGRLTCRTVLGVHSTGTCWQVILVAPSWGQTFGARLKRSLPFLHLHVDLQAAHASTEWNKKICNIKTY